MLAGAVLNVLLLSWLYAYYCFDYKWSLQGTRLPLRLMFFETNWAFFAGDWQQRCQHTHACHLLLQNQAGASGTSGMYSHPMLTSATVTPSTSIARFWAFWLCMIPGSSGCCQEGMLCGACRLWCPLCDCHCVLSFPHWGCLGQHALSGFCARCLWMRPSGSSR
jgi:hypothetical protein